MPFIVILNSAITFYLAWSPDGSFLRVVKPSSGSPVLVKSRPAIVVTPSLKSDKLPTTTLPLLQTHKKYCIKTKETENEAPIFTLPRNTASGNEALFHALEDYSKSSSMCSFDNATQKVVSNVFSLLVSLYGGLNTSGSVTEISRLEAVSNWLKKVVAGDMMKAISTAQSLGDRYGSIFSALSGGDVVRASSVALLVGCPRLSLILSNSSVQAQPCCVNQLEMWHKTGAQQFTPTSILRIFSLASGSIDIEREMYKTDSASYDIDWRRRFGIHLWSCSHSQKQTTLPSVVKQYAMDVSAGLAPPATPLYYDIGPKPTKQCILYQILNHYENTNIPLAHIIDPSSHTPFANDFSASFHFCATMSALADCNLSRTQEDLIIDSLSSQLISEGLWEWAVYVSLCSIGNAGKLESSTTARMIRAKNIILRFHSPTTDPLAESRGSFLQSIGIPSRWLAEALAYRSVSEGEIFGMLDNFMQYSASDSLIVMERFVIPHMILEGEKSRTQLWQLLESLKSNITEESFVDWTKPNGCGMYYQFLALVAEVEMLSKMQTEHEQMCDADINHLILLATDLEAMISKGSATKINKSTLPFVKVGYGVRRTPLYVLTTEIGNMLSTICMQLMAIKTGKPLNHKSQLALTRPSQLSFPVRPDSLYADSFIRGLCGFKTRI